LIAHLKTINGQLVISEVFKSIVGIPVLFQQCKNSCDCVFVQVSTERHPERYKQDIGGTLLVLDFILALYVSRTKV